MSSRVKLKKDKKNSDIQFTFEALMNSVHSKMQKLSPGSSMVANPDKEGVFIVRTPFQEVELISPVMFGALIQFTNVVGEASLIRVVQRANELRPLLYSVTDSVPDDKKSSPENFINNMMNGQAIELGMIVDKLNELDDNEGAAFGMLMCVSITQILHPFNVSIVSPNETQIYIKAQGQLYPIASPTIFLYVIRHIMIKGHDDIVSAAVLSNIIQNPQAATANFN